MCFATLTCPDTYRPPMPAKPTHKTRTHITLPQDLLLHLSPDALDFARWAGFRLPPPPEPGGPAEAASAQLERLLRLKMLLLVAVALRMRAFRWGAAMGVLPAVCVQLVRCMQAAQHSVHRPAAFKTCGSHCLCRWQGKLPEEVQAAGRCGAPCPLFWPCSPDYEPPALGEWAEGVRKELAGRGL